MGGSQEKYMAAPCTPKDVNKKNMFTRKCYVHNKTVQWRNGGSYCWKYPRFCSQT